MEKIHKQKAGFRFGLHKLKVIKEIGQVFHLGRTYRVVFVETETRQKYLSIRLYNNKGKFIKQFLMEPEIGPQIGRILEKTTSLEKGEAHRRDAI